MSRGEITVGDLIVGTKSNGSYRHFQISRNYGFQVIHSQDSYMPACKLLAVSLPGRILSMIGFNKLQAISRKENKLDACQWHLGLCIAAVS
jgi:hypothetical protein